VPAASLARVGRVSGMELEPVQVRVLPREEAQPPVLRDEVRTAAIAAAGGVLAGAATVAAVRAVSSVGSKARSPRRRSRPRERRANVIGSRSFLIDVHLLDR
jgi:hypothetical protein